MKAQRGKAANHWYENRTSHTQLMST